MELMKDLWLRVTQQKKTIVLPEGEEERTIEAAAIILKNNLASIILIGDEEIIRDKALKLDVNIDKSTIINPLISDKRNFYAEKLYELRKAKGMTIEIAKKLVLNNIYFGVMMLKLGDADGLVAGAVNSTSDLLRAGLQIIKTAPGTSLVSSYFLMIVPNCKYGSEGVFLFADCGLIINPNASELALISLQTAETARKLFNLDPKIALLSFLTKGSAEHELINKVREALSIAKTVAPSLKIDGELQLDAAIVPSIANKKAPNSKVAGDANILIFPDLNSGNIGYKLVERLAKAQAIGPLCQGFSKPINDLSRGCSVDDIVKSVVITAIQAQTDN
ncbi:MAG: phosphate acetyltransferase [Bacilli bacterium]|nr:phosphate acetyltransferase [Bacilli bacterium]MDD3305193.1 phosphate acetyltransferase [Bacilli bacterium]MDD4053240.1 phosphate acetyltransferase [Bacilli bacterium]MDD4411236.1 phosphate acetyltransferase [Bacilli bacterium]